MNIRRIICELPQYVVPQNGARIKLNQNESPFDVPEQLKKEILSRLENVSWNRYPACNAARIIKALSRYTNLSDDCIFVGNGSNEILQAIFSATCEQTDPVVFVSPGYSVFSRLAQILRLRVTTVPLLEDFRFDVTALMKEAARARLVVLATPNNPTGTTLSLKEIEAITACSNGVVVIDEAYYEFNKITAQVLLKTYNNLIITRTFSKAFGLAGLRLGYLLTQPENAREIEKARLPFSVGIFQQIAGEVLLGNSDVLDRVIQEIIDERERIFSLLRALPGITPIPSSANFILFHVEGMSAEAVFKTLYKKGVLIRHFNSERINKMLRVTIGKPAENDVFISCLQELTGT